jgi:hypothetical protein
MKGSSNLASFFFGFFAQTSGKTGGRKDTQRWRFELSSGLLPFFYAVQRQALIRGRF